MSPCFCVLHHLCMCVWFLLYIHYHSNHILSLVNRDQLVRNYIKALMSFGGPIIYYPFLFFLFKINLMIYTCVELKLFKHAGVLEIKRSSPN